MKKIKLFSSESKENVWCLSEMQQKAINEKATNVAINMHVHHTIFEYKGVDISNVIQIDFYYYLKALFSVEQYVIRIRELDEASEVFLQVNSILESELLNGYIRVLGEDWNIVNETNFKHGVKGWAKKNYLENIMKIGSYLFFNKNKNKNRNKTENRKTLILYEINNQSMIDLLNVVSREIESIDAYYNNDTIKKNISSDLSQNSIYSELKAKTIIQCIKYFSKKEFCKFKINFEEAVSAEIHNKDLVLMFLKETKKLFYFFFFSTVLEFECLDKIMKDNKYSNLLLASDSHKTSRLAVNLARKNDIKSYVIQHGTIGRLAFTPIYSNYFFSWGEIPKAQLISLGESRNRIIVTGNPRLDWVRSNGSLSNEVSDIHRFLVITNPIGVENLVSFINIIASGLKEIKEPYELTVRLHPGESNHDTITNTFKSNNVKFKLDASIDIIESIDKSDFVIVSNSTAGIEVLARGKSLFVLDLGERVPMYIPYKDYDAAHIIFDSLSFVKEFEKYRSVEDPQKIKNNEKLLEDYLGNETSSQSIKNIIKEMG